MSPSNNNRTSLRRSIIGSLRRSVSPFSKVPTSSSETLNKRESIQSTKEIFSEQINRFLPTRSASTAGRYSTAVQPNFATSIETTPKSVQDAYYSQRQSIVSFNLPPPVIKTSPPQDESSLTIRPPSNAGRYSPSFRTSWLFRTPSARSRLSRRNSSRFSISRPLQSISGRETALSVRKINVDDIDEDYYRPKNPPFDRDIDIVVRDDEEPADPDIVFGQVLLPLLNTPQSPLSDLPVHVRRNIYSYCFPVESRKITLSPKFATEDCFFGDYFASPWDVLEPVWGGLASSKGMRNELMTYFWTEYGFHVTLSPFNGPFFSPLSNIWMKEYLDRIQHLTLEIDFTRFGHSAMKNAREFGYNMNKLENLLIDVVNGILKRSGRSTMAELHLICRRFKGIRQPVLDRPGNEMIDDPFDHCPEDSVWICDAVINLRGILKMARISGFPMDYTEILLQCMFGEGEDGAGWTLPIASAWPPMPPQPEPVCKIKKPPVVAESRPTTPAGNLFSMSTETLRSRLGYEPSLYSNREADGVNNSPALTASESRPGTSHTSHSALTMTEHFRRYQDVLPPLTPSDTSETSDAASPDLIETPRQQSVSSLNEHEVCAENPNYEEIGDMSERRSQDTPSLRGSIFQTSNTSKSRLSHSSLADEKTSCKDLPIANQVLIASLPATPPKKRKSLFNERPLSYFNSNTINLEDRRLLTPSPSAQPTTTSPNTLNNINERDPAYLRSLDALRSASASVASVVPPPIPEAREYRKTARPFSMMYSSNMGSLNMAMQKRSITSMGVGMEKTKSHSLDGEHTTGRRCIRFLDRLRGRKN